MRLLTSLFAILFLASSALAQDDWKALVTKSSTGFDVEGARKVSPEEALALLNDGATFVDVRRSGQFGLAHIPGAINLDVNSKLNEESLSEHVKKDQQVVFYGSDAQCHRSANASAMAISWGFSDVVYYADGWAVWIAKDYPRN